MAVELQDAPPDITERVWRLVDAYHPHLAEARLVVQVRELAPVKDGFTTMAEVDTADNDEERADFDFSMWFAWDEWQTLDDVQRDAIVDHELCHCGWDKAGKPFLIDHDIQEFNAIIARYGLWWPSADETRLALHEAATSPDGAEGKFQMPNALQRPMPGNHGSTGALQRPMPGNHGSTGAMTGVFQKPQPGNHGSTGALQQPMPGNHGSTGAMTDPHLTPGADYHAIDLGNGETLELCPDCYRAVAATVLADLQAMLG